MQFSKNTVKLLKVFYSRPKEPLYIQQLGRLLKKKPGVFQRTLYKLEKQGVLRSNYQANARFFSLNKSYRFYNEFKAIVGKMSIVLIVLCALNFLGLGVSMGFSDVKEPDALTLASLEDAVKIAYKNNKDIQIQEYGLKVSDADILDARSAFLPQLTLNAGYARNGAVLNSANTNPKKDIRTFSGYKNNNQADVSLAQAIYNGGANISALREAQVALREQKETLRATKLNVEFEAKRLYYGLLLAYETRRIAEDLVEQAKSHYLEVKHKFDQGTSSRFDVLQSKVQVSLLLPQLINAQTSIDLIAAEMDKLLGLKVGSQITLNDKLIYEPLEIKEEDFLRKAYVNQPEMILKSLGIDMSKWAVKYAKAGWLPQIEANAQYIGRSNNIGNMFDNKHNNWNAGFTMSLAIFDGFSTKAKVDGAKAKYMQAVIEKDNYSDQVALDVKQACLDLINANAIIQSQQDNLQDAKEALEISYVRYNNGVGINLDVLDAQVSLANVEKNLANGIYDYIIAKAKLDRVMGNGLVGGEK